MNKKFIWGIIRFTIFFAFYYLTYIYINKIVRTLQSNLNNQPYLFLLFRQLYGKLLFIFLLGVLFACSIIYSTYIFNKRFNPNKK